MKKLEFYVEISLNPFEIRASLKQESERIAAKVAS